MRTPLIITAVVTAVIYAVFLGALAVVMRRAKARNAAERAADAGMVHDYADADEFGVRADVPTPREATS